MAAAWEIPRLQEYGRPSKMFPKGGAIVFDFEKPKIEIAEISEDKRYGKFVVEPLERGYGTTLGNSCFL